MPTTDAVPVLIGVTGKRCFSPDPAEHARLAVIVRQRMAAAFRYISRQCPHVPKVLLTGGAAGTDLIAAEVAREIGDDWSIIVVLPYAAEVFEKDFRTADGQVTDLSEFVSFVTLLANAESGAERRVMVRTLPPLRTPDGAAALQQQMDKSSVLYDKALRRQHYEQVGQFIASAAMLLVAVMGEAEQPDLTEATGGTARIAAYRRAGRPDPLGTSVAMRSDVLRCAWNELLTPSAGYLWLIDPSSDQARNRLPFRVLPPLYDFAAGEVYQGRPGSDLPKSGHGRSGQGLTWHRWPEWLARLPISLGPDRRHLRRSLTLLRGFDEFQRLRQKVGGRPNLSGRRLPTSLATVADPIAETASLRGMIRPVQRLATQMSERAFFMVAGLFVLAVLGLETFAKFVPTKPVVLAVYPAALVFIGLVIVWHRRQRWQPRSEDYRATSEMLRVQRAWWGAGLADRVDHVHLQGVDRDLARPRDAARVFLDWVWLRSSWRSSLPPTHDWTQVRDVVPHQQSDQPRETKMLAAQGQSSRNQDWVGDQIGYYARSQKRHEGTASLRNAATWFCFTTAGLLSLILVGNMAGVPSWLKPTLHSFAGFPSTATAGVFWPLLAAAIGWCRLRWHEAQEGWSMLALTALCSVLAAACLTVASSALGQPLVALLDWLHLGHGEKADHATVSLTIVLFVFLTAVAGALRFLTEKRAIEAAALAYHDALGKFERAERRLAALTDPRTGVPRDKQAARLVVRELGTLALRENEAWLKAHRERPLSPVVG